MATRTVSVKLEAVTTAFNSAMLKAGQTTKQVMSGIDSSVEKAGSRLEKLGPKAQLAGAAIAGGLALAVKNAMDFESSMSKMVGLVGLSTNEVNEMQSEILALANETGKSQVELADAMFVVTSAGLRGADALSALEYASRASAAGLGEAQDIARSLAGAMNAYGPSVLSAADATDQIVATARAGNFETSQFASAIGRVLPMAKQAGATFADMGGAVALLTRTNGNAAESITGITALFKAFVVPTAEAVKVLSSVGLSAEDLRNKISADGLPAALAMLDSALGGNREQLGRLLGSSEAATAAFQILDADAKAIASTFGVVADAAGMTDEAFDAVSQTAKFKMDQAMTSLNGALIQIGGALIPVLVPLAELVSKAADAFSKMPAPVQTVIALTAALGAAALIAAPKILAIRAAFAQIRTEAALTGATVNRTMAGRIGRIGGGALAVSAVAGVGIAANQSAEEVGKLYAEMSKLETFGGKDFGADGLEQLRENTARLKAEYEDFGNPAGAIKSFFNVGVAVIGDAARGDFGFTNANQLTDALLDPSAWQKGERLLWAFSQTAEIVAMNLGISVEKAEELVLASGVKYGGSVKEAAAGAMEYATANEHAADASLAAADAQAAMSDTTNTLADDLKALTSAVTAQMDVLFGMRNAKAGVYAAAEKLAAAERENGLTLDYSTKAGRENLAVMQALVGSANELGLKRYEEVAASGDLVGAEEKAIKVREQYIRRSLEAAGASEEQIKKAIRLAKEIELIPSSKTTDINVNTSSAESKLSSWWQTMQQRYGTMNVDIIGSEGWNRSPSNRQPTGRYTGGPVMNNLPYVVGEQGPEVFVPMNTGEILNARQWEQLMNNVGGHTDNSNMNINVFETSNAVHTASRIANIRNRQRENRGF